MTTLRVLLYVAAQRDYELHSLDFSIVFLQSSLHEEIWLRHPPGLIGSFPPGTQWSLRQPVYGLRQAPREWPDTLRTTLAALGFAPSTADPSLVLCTDTSLPPFYVLVYVDDLVFASFDTDALALVKSELQKRHICTKLLSRNRGACFAWGQGQAADATGASAWEVSSGVDVAVAEAAIASITATVSPSDKSVEPTGMGLVLGGRGPVVLIGHADASWVDDSAMKWLSLGYIFSLGSDSVSWQSSRSSSVLNSSCEAEIYAGAMAAQELRWLTNLLSDLGEQPRLPPVLYVDNKAMIALCQEHRLEHRTKHIALRYFLARELQQRGQLRLAYVATRANTANIFTKALPPGRLLLPYLFPELSAFATVKDLVSHLRSSDARYRAAVPAECLVSPRFEQHLVAAETSLFAVGAARGTPCTPFFDGCSPSPLSPSYTSAATVDVPDGEDVRATSASPKRRSRKGKGGRGGGGGSGGGGGGSSRGGGDSGGGGGSGSGGRSGSSGSGSGSGSGSSGSGSGGGGGSGGSGSGGSRARATQRGGSGGGQRQQ
ncbi:unnamed protein product [Closterium sp. NIES-54]